MSPLNQQSIFQWQLLKKPLLKDCLKNELLAHTEAKLQEQMGIFGDNLSAKGIILQYNSKLQWGLFILQPSK